MVPTSSISRTFLSIVAFRWLLWLLAAVLLGLNAGLAARRPLLLAIVIASSALYLLAWSFRFDWLVAEAKRQPALLLVDFVISVVPIWVTGGWTSPFLPFAFGALILPGVLFSWRGVVAALIAYAVADQLMGWTSWHLGQHIPLGSPWSVLSYVPPVLAAALWPLGTTVRHLRRRAPLSRTLAPSLPVRISTPTGSRIMRAVEISSGSLRPEPDGAAAAWGLARARSQTLEHPSAMELYAAIRQVVAEAEEHGLTIHLVLDGSEPQLPQDHIHLLGKAVEIGLDNIRRHAHADEAEVTLACDGSHIHLAVRDHGVGLLDGTAEPPGFHQLRRLRYRLQEIEGNLDVQEDDAGGVLLAVKVPRP